MFESKATRRLVRDYATAGLLVAATYLVGGERAVGFVCVAFFIVSMAVGAVKLFLWVNEWIEKGRD